MGQAMQWVRSLIFNVSMYLAMFVIAIAFAPMALFSRHWARRACLTWCNWVRWSAAWMIGLRSEVRGTPPTGEVMIAAKHQSFLDIILIFSSVPAGKFIMKRELKFAPLLGQYAMRIGCVPVDRGKRGRAIKQMLQDVGRGLIAPGQLIIYPQGTRVAPGVDAPYKTGTGVLYQQLGQPCVPVATNVGAFWPRRGVVRKPGLAVVEFLPEIEPGLPLPHFMDKLRQDIEGASDKLLAETGLTPEEIEEVER
ncbi:1-acyl-sn-glycerol-3-phosphate acyltransferase [Tranquillimonas rosea]|uniref:1-acyl-sn-glycerol-3-phosphate acyltransferase n=1 Tax=Tranquillimonas rosea TaxID=641238 RepID=A0A1H9R779_9RHOB|nr:lysophospholipid acyltransferase family protein [Tranquillimonas rosea]SER68395.1 1-acyl-sn-glycerol-3-phosphate acyltransferase [Tranquillimonas rosea]